MGTAAENIAAETAESNAAWRALSRALFASGGAGSVGEALREALGEALGASRAERAFLVEAPRGGGTPRLLAAVSRREDGTTAPSLSVLRRALASRKPLSCPDLLVDRLLADGASVHGLELRSFLSIPVRPEPATALVLDSRSRPAARNAPPAEALEALGALLALLLRLPSSAPAPPRSPSPAPHLETRSVAFAAAVDAVRRAAPTRLPVLLLGETGSGKEVLARLVHAESTRRGGPFVTVNCAAVPEALIESELFGAAKGAYTGSERDRPGLFSRADGGTLFLDEIGDMPQTMQAKLLRVLQDGRVRPVGGDEQPVDVRVVAATHRDLTSMTQAGAFRGDLFYRLSVVPVPVPPLRARLADLPELSRTLLERLHLEAGLPRRTLASSALERLARHRWPGNVRELEAVLARAALRAPEDTVLPEHLDLPEAAAGPGDPRSAALEETMLRSALREAGGSIKVAAAKIGWTRQKLYRRMARHGIAVGSAVGG